MDQARIAAALPRGGFFISISTRTHAASGLFLGYANALFGGIISFNMMVARPDARIERGASRAQIEII